MADDQFPRKSKKARVSVTIDESLVADAKKFGYNISETAQKGAGAESQNRKDAALVC